MGANYNARPCADGRKAAGAGTMGINGKRMQRTMEIMRNTEDGLRPVVTSEDGKWGCPAASRTKFVCRDGWMSPGAIPTLSFMPLAQTENARNNEIDTTKSRPCCDRHGGRN